MIKSTMISISDIIRTNKTSEEGIWPSKKQKNNSAPVIIQQESHSKKLTNSTNVNTIFNLHLKAKNNKKLAKEPKKANKHEALKQYQKEVLHIDNTTSSDKAIGESDDKIMT